MARKDPIAHLGRHPFELPHRLRDEVLALGRPGLEQLVAIVEDRARWDADPVLVRNALRILGHAGDPIGLPVALRAHAEAEFDDVIYATAGWALGKLIRPDDYEPLMALTVDPARDDDATEILVRAGVRDPRLVPRLEALVGREPARGAELCHLFGDPALVPVLEETFEACLERIEAELDYIMTAVELHTALDGLGSVDASRMDRVEEAFRIYAARQDKKFAHLLDSARRARADPTYLATLRPMSS